MSKRMCKSWVKTTDKSDQYKTNGGYCVRYATTGKLTCPKNTNSRCEIVPKKPKMVKVKAWANRYRTSIIVSTRKDDLFNIPCTILIAEKHLKHR